jgi:hypothetical protein
LVLFRIVKSAESGQFDSDSTVGQAGSTKIKTARQRRTQESTVPQRHCVVATGLRRHKSKPYAGTTLYRVVLGGLTGAFGIIAAYQAVWTQKINHVRIASAFTTAVTMLNGAQPVMMPTARRRSARLNTGKQSPDPHRRTGKILWLSLINQSMVPLPTVRRWNQRRFKNNFHIRPRQPGKIFSTHHFSAGIPLI